MATFNVNLYMITDTNIIWRATLEDGTLYEQEMGPTSVKADAIAYFTELFATLYPSETFAQTMKVSFELVEAEGSYKIFDGNGKPIIALSRDLSGNTSIEAIDTSGNKRRVLLPQSGTIKLDETATIADVTFDQPFDVHPVVNITPSKPLPNYDMTVTKQGFSVDFATPPGATIAFEAKAGKK